MISRFSRVVLFFSSYAPLTLAFSVLYLKDTPQIAASLFVFCAASVYGLWGLLRTVKDLSPLSIVAEQSGQKDSETLSYLATYLVPFALAPPRDVYAAIALAIFIAVLAYLYITTNMIYINPVLSLFGYHIFEVKPKNTRHTIVVLTRAVDELPEHFQAVAIAHRIYVALP